MKALGYWVLGLGYRCRVLTVLSTDAVYCRASSRLRLVHPSQGNATAPFEELHRRWANQPGRRT